MYANISVEAASKATYSLTELVEGQARILQEGNEAFYNKAQVQNRDLSIAVIRMFHARRQAELKAGKGPFYAFEDRKALEEAGLVPVNQQPDPNTGKRPRMPKVRRWRWRWRCLPSLPSALHPRGLSLTYIRSPNPPQPLPSPANFPGP